MKKSIKKFLEFNGTELYFSLIDGQFFIALKPICSALEIDYNRQFQNLKEHPILSLLFAKQQIVAKDGKLRIMICLPERYIYGWLLSVKSDNKALIEYQYKCYDILYDYFHGTITKRSELLNLRKRNLDEIDKLSSKLGDLDTDFKRITTLRQSNKQINRELSNLDKKIIQSEQLSLF
jgi:hypothetical protein